MDLGHVAGDEPLQTISLGNQPAEFEFILRHHTRFGRLGIAQSIPIPGFERLLDSLEKLGNGLESDGYSPVSAAMWAHASLRSVRLFDTNGRELASLFTLAWVSCSRQNS